MFQKLSVFERILKLTISSKTDYQSYEAVLIKNDRFIRMLNGY